MYLTSAGELGEQLGDKLAEANKLLDTLEGYIPKIIQFGINLLIALIIFFIGRFVIKIILKIFKRFFKKVGTDPGVSRFLLSLSKVGLYIVLVTIICSVVGIATTSFIAVLGSGGLAFGLAMQGALSNLAGGLTILLVKPFRVGDYIIEEMNNGVEGVVNKIDLFYTSLTTGDNKIILIPNGTLTSSRIVNVTTNRKRRVDFTIGISYKSNIQVAKNVMWEVINDYEPILLEDEMDVVVKALGESKIIMEARVWVLTPNYSSTLCYLNETMKLKLEQAGIEIPYNQLDVHIV